jgi:hypothetical protein
MPEFPVPEILRVPLDNILLAVKVAREGDAKVRLYFAMRRRYQDAHRSSIGVSEQSH